MLLETACYFVYYLRKVKKAQRLNPSELEELQNRKLRAIVKHAYKNVPYYHELFNSAKVKPEDIKTKEDLVKIPITTKKMLQELPINQRVSRGVDINRCTKGRTSGSTGQPLDVLFSRKEMSYRIAMQSRLHGFNFSDKKVNILDRGTWPSPGSPAMIFENVRKCLNRLGLWRRYSFSLFDEPQGLVRKLLEIKPDIIETYPSILKLMVRFMKEKNILGITPRIIFSEAELLNEEDRKEIETVFGGKLTDLYGTVELGNVAWECKEHPGYHINSDIVLVEAIKDNQQVYGEEGEMVCTDLTNYTMPFIRYAVGDIVILSNERHNCGNNFPVIKLIQGRSDDFITSPSGKIVSPLLLGICLEKIEGIGQYKLVQETTDIFNVQIVKGQNFNEATIREFENALRETLDSSVHININIVDEIPREKSGKIRPIVSKVPVTL